MVTLKIFVNWQFYQNFDITFMKNVKTVKKISYFVFSHKKIKFKKKKKTNVLWPSINFSL